ncbi:sensor histidine kinase [Bailinhaonella thermotolerans]|uniref:Sensor histidine kinase n=1 Tax=Bailinhaonella thermotolerans TaxID=1070861 RepID=A0A3A4BN06_9ACTN|nr:sensor histidine kinase [Bailinhaonella thermotolerans]RJL32454.1 sensor histidine kinase [Bailinhaonella thermotolerans]
MNAQRLAVAVVYTISIGFPLNLVLIVLTHGSPRQLVVTLLGLAVFFAAHHRQVNAALRDERPRGFPYALAAQALAAYVPALFLGGLYSYSWLTSMPTILAGAVLLRLPLVWGAVAACAIGAGNFLAGLRVLGQGTLAMGLYNLLTVVVTGFVIYAVVRLVVVSRELARAREELAEAAVLKERLRISRDLHDGLGRSLTAIALKGDLAGRMLDRDPSAAAGELTELVRVAREAAQDVRQVARGYREARLGEEAARAVSLLETAGVSCRADLEGPDLPRPAEEALAWALREAVTNVIRHSRATTCAISVRETGGAVRLTVVNDGAPERGPDGGGLTGLRERIEALGGRAGAERSADGEFRLSVEVPL